MKKILLLGALFIFLFVGFVSTSYAHGWGYHDQRGRKIFPTHTHNRSIFYGHRYHRDVEVIIVQPQSICHNVNLRVRNLLSQYKTIGVRYNGRMYGTGVVREQEVLLQMRNCTKSIEIDVRDKNGKLVGYATRDGNEFDSSATWNITDQDIQRIQ